MSEILYSKHIFMFPFNWDCVNKNRSKKDKIKVSTNIKNFIKIIEEDNEWKKNWDEDIFECKSRIEYNEKNYFYNSVSRAIYSIDNDENIVHNYKYKLNKENENNYIIRIKNSDGKLEEFKDGKLEEFKLDIDEINLQVYKAGVALLSFKTSNYRYSKKEEILLINNYGRRINIPFFKANNGEDKIDLPIGEVPQEVILKIGRVEIKQNFEDYLNIKENESIKCGISKIITGVLGEELFINEDTAICKSKDYILIQHTIDDRMYVMCWYGNNNLVSYMDKNGIYLSKKELLNFYDICNEKYTYENSDFWYKYIFVDGSSRTCNSIPMLNRVLKENTYDRWADYGTLYGASRYSFMELTSTYDVLLNNEAEYLVEHFETMYYKMIRLILIQRTCILRFSEKVANISVKLNAINSNSKIINEAEDIYESYLEFVNNIFFREFTAQDQGIELHKLIVNSIQLEDHVEKLKSEIEELRNLILLKADKKTASSLQILTWVGSIITILSFIMSLTESDVIKNFGFNRIVELMYIFIIIISVLSLGILLIICIGRDLRKFFRMIGWKNE